jgi:hypothetical protein
LTRPALTRTAPCTPATAGDTRRDDCSQRHCRAGRKPGPRGSHNNTARTPPGPFPRTARSSASLVPASRTPDGAACGGRARGPVLDPGHQLARHRSSAGKGGQQRPPARGASMPRPAKPARRPRTKPGLTPARSFRDEGFRGIKAATSAGKSLKPRACQTDTRTKSVESGSRLVRDLRMVSFLAGTPGVSCRVARHAETG